MEEETPTPVATPTPDAELPQWVKDMMEEYGFTLSPEAAVAFANMATNMGLELAKSQMDYQKQFIEQKAKELDLSDRQIDLMTKQFEFQSGPYWDWFSGEKFEFDKQMAQNAFDLSKLNLETQTGLSKEELARSKNMTTSTLAQAEAAKATAEAQKWQALAAMGGAEQQQALQVGQSDLLWGAAR